MADRIQQMMAELSLDQVDLLDRVPDMSAQTLSILLKRRSRKSQFAPQIAEALGVTAGWLLSGASPKYARPDGDLRTQPRREGASRCLSRPVCRATRRAGTVCDLARQAEDGTSGANLMRRMWLAMAALISGPAQSKGQTIELPCDAGTFDERTLAACLSALKITDPGDVMSADRTHLPGGNVFTLTMQSAPGVVHICTVKSLNGGNTDRPTCRYSVTLRTEK